MFRVSIIKFEKYKKFRVQATPKGEDIRIDKEFYSKIDCYSFVNEWERTNRNQWTHGEWRETRTSLTPEPLNDAQIAETMLPPGTTLCELVNTNKRVLVTKEIRVLKTIG